MAATKSVILTSTINKVTMSINIPNIFILTVVKDEKD